MSLGIHPVVVKTSERTQLVEITEKVAQIVEQSGIKEGTCYLYTPHTTAALTINENADPTVVTDIVTALNKLIPFSDGYKHSEGNSAAHIKSSLTGVSLTLFVHGGKLLLGTWQGIYFCEFDGPRQRQVLVKVIAD